MSSVNDLSKERKKETLFLFKDHTGQNRYRKRRLDWVENGVKKKTCWFECQNQAGQWVKKAPPDRYLYNVHRLVKAPPDEPVFVVEGENKCDALEQLGLLGVCNDAGAGASKWHAEWAELFKDHVVIILPDNDLPGHAHATGIRDLLLPGADTCVILELDGLGPKHDIIDWLQVEGNTKAKLLDLVAAKLTEAIERPACEPAIGDAYEPDEDRSIDPEEPPPGWVPFPLELLPAVLSDYIQAAAEALCCDPAFVALPVLVATGGVIGNSRAIPLKETWREPAIFWGCVIADSSTLKSPSLQLAIAPLRQLDRELSRQYRDQLRLFDAEMLAWEESGGKRTRAWAETERYPQPQKPPEGRLIISDITVEKVAELIQQNPKGLILCMDELAGWFSSFARYKPAGSGANDMGFWLSAHRGEEIRVDRKSGTRASIVTDLSAISVVGTVQPTIAARIFTRDVFDAGMVARLLLVHPPKLPKRWSDAVIPPEIRDAYHQLLRTLFYLDREAIAEDDYSRICCHFTDAGKACWIEFYNNWGTVQWDSDGEQGSCLAKLEAYCARFALLLAEVDFHSGQTANEQIDATHVDRAHRLVHWFSEEATRIYAQVQTSAPDVRQERLLSVIYRHGGQITARELYRSNRARMGSVEKSAQVLEELVKAGLGRWEKMGAGPKGGRPSKTFICFGSAKSAKTS